MKKLPIGIQTFSEIITENYVYVDKTEFALNLIQQGKYYFLSRPRRFGKSLFLDTLKEIFSGNKEYFEGLYIYDKYEFEEYPVLKINFGGVRNSVELIEQIFFTLRHNATKMDITSNSENFSICFADLIRQAHHKYGKRVVILIDEYDKPILDVIDEPEVSKANLEILKSFYSVIKDNDEYVKFAFITGVTKFAKVSVFSGLNNLDDLTLDKDFAAIAGYSQNDIETTFKPYLNGVDFDKLKEWYNGYSFNGEKIYNPFDILLFISKGLVYDNYWFSTGTQAFLIKLLKEGNYFIPRLENLVTGKELVDCFDIENVKLEPILFQSGYLTIDKIEELEFGGFNYHLKHPNKEVQISFNDILITYLTGNDTYIPVKSALFQALKDGDLEKLKDTLNSVFASIPYNNYVNNTISNYEGYYASVIYAYIAALGIKVIAEDVTSLGRIDLTIFVADKLYILEFKVGSEDALAQIKEKKYEQKYLDCNRVIYLVGINFDDSEKNISKFQYEKL